VTPFQAYEQSLLAIAGWREARNQASNAVQAMLWSIRNRVYHPTIHWWGAKGSWAGVILAHEQYSSFNANDPNAVKLPLASDQVFPLILDLAASVYAGTSQDLSQGADS
jgi:hypothetical protein